MYPPLRVAVFIKRLQHPSAEYRPVVAARELLDEGLDVLECRRLSRNGRRWFTHS